MMEPIYWGNNPPEQSIIVTHRTQKDLLDDLSGKMQERSGYTLATVNLDHCVKLKENSEFKLAYKAHSHVVADGNPIIWLSRLAGKSVDLVPGSELILPLAELAARHKVPIALFGATEQSLDAAAKVLRAKFPDLQIVATISPPFGFDPRGQSANDLIAQLKKSGARLCFVALGAPKQEIFAVRAAAEIPECGFASIGAGLDFIAGSQKRAPVWVQRIAMEWLWRLAENPKRLAKRYGSCIAILPELMKAARSQRRAGQKN